jgi:hypothetical protein
MNIGAWGTHPQRADTDDTTTYHSQSSNPSDRDFNLTEWIPPMRQPAWFQTATARRISTALVGVAAAGTVAGFAGWIPMEVATVLVGACLLPSMYLSRGKRDDPRRAEADRPDGSI